MVTSGKGEGVSRIFGRIGRGATDKNQRLMHSADDAVRRFNSGKVCAFQPARFRHEIVDQVPLSVGGKRRLKGGVASASNSQEAKGPGYIWLERHDTVANIAPRLAVVENHACA